MENWNSCKKGIVPFQLLLLHGISRAINQIKTVIIEIKKGKLAY
jgi:hypothetical protein